MKNRSIWKMFALEIITLGIYRLYYFIKTRREMMDRDPSVKILSPAFLLAPVGVILLGLVVMIVMSVSSASNQADRCSTYGTYPSNSYNTTSLESPANGSCPMSSGAGDLIGIGLFYLAFLVGGILMVVWLWSYAHGVDKTTQGKLSFAITLVILVLVPDGIDILIIQDYFNKLEPRTPEAAQPPATPQPPAEPQAPVEAL